MPPRRSGSAPHRRPRAGLALLLSAPLAWLVAAYLGSLAVLLSSAFWTVDDFTFDVERVWNTDNFAAVLTTPVYWAIALRTLGIAGAVTVIDVLIAFPMAFFMARVASPRWRRVLVVAVLTPLWASYLVKAYAWRVMFGVGGVVDRLAAPFGGSSPGYGVAAVIVVLAYLWLPYMILPIYAGLERIPASVLDASADLGATTVRTLRSVIVPLVVPSVFAGSVFTFSLSLGDYIAVQIVGGTTQMIGNVIASEVTLNLPLAAALSCVPVAMIVGYLLAVRRTGALDSL
jgi:putative spermidine/putrescine transport system permease protein